MNTALIPVHTTPQARPEWATQYLDYKKVCFLLPGLHIGLPDFPVRSHCAGSTVPVRSRYAGSMDLLPGPRLQNPHYEALLGFRQLKDLINKSIRKTEAACGSNALHRWLQLSQSRIFLLVALQQLKDLIKESVREAEGATASTIPSLLFFCNFPPHFPDDVISQLEDMIKENVAEAEAGGDMISYLHLSTEERKERTPLSPWCVAAQGPDQGERGGGGGGRRHDQLLAAHDVPVRGARADAARRC